MTSSAPQYGPPPTGQQALDDAVVWWSSKGFMVQSRSERQVILVKPHKWVPHLIATVLTCGTWALAWPFFAFLPTRRAVLSVGPAADVVTQTFRR